MILAYILYLTKFLQLMLHKSKYNVQSGYNKLHLLMFNIVFVMM